MDDEQSKANQFGTQQPSDSRASAPLPAILRLLNPDSGRPLDNPALRRELASMIHLMHRLETLAREQLGEDAEPYDSTKPGDDSDKRTVGQNVVAFDPAEFGRPPHSSPAYVPDIETAVQGPVAEPSGQVEPEPEQDDHLERWWVHFNGNVSLERLARFRTVMGGSPFTIDARFAEITDGLIVMRLVTERHLTDEQVDWIVRQVMDSVGLDRNAAILSRN